jgi:hypothetical protein
LHKVTKKIDIMKSLFKILVTFLLMTGLAVPALSQSNVDPIMINLLNNEIKQAIGMTGQNREMSLPQGLEQYLWQDENWVIDAFEERSYHYNGLIHQMTIYEPDSRIPMARYTYTYNALWLNTEILIEHWDGTYWYFFSRWAQAYDLNGNPTENITYLWTGSWTMIAGNRKNYTYNASQWITGISMEMLQGGSWTNTTNEVYTLDGNGYPTEILYQYWYAGWGDSDRKKDIVWHDYSPYSGKGKFEFYIWESWSGTEWTPEIKETSTFDGSGGFVRVQESWNGMGWVNALKETLTMNWGLVQEDKVENWAGNQWIQTSGDRYFYTFSGIDMTEKIVQDFDAQYSDYRNSLKYVYSAFLHVVGSDDHTLQDDQIMIYPNPATDHLFIELNGPSEVAEIRITNLAGQVVYHRFPDDQDHPAQYDLHLNRLPKGFYLVKISGENLFCIKKVIID